MLAAAVQRTRDTAVCRGHRHGLRLSRDAEDGTLRVHACSLADGRWRRVDHDVVALTRAATRLLVLDPAAARTMVGHAIELADVPPRDTHPVTGLIRAALPLLATPPPWPLAGLPDATPAGIDHVLRARDPRTAARRLVGDRATRPVARALSEQLIAHPRVDVLLLELAACAAPLLEPDHLARLLRPAGGSDLGAAGRAPLGEGGVDRLRATLAAGTPHRVLRLLEEARDDAVARRRVRFVATAAAPHEAPDLHGGWPAIALQVLGGGAPRG